MLFCNVVGARPNFMKMAPVVLEMKKRGMRQVLLHTGQHYDRRMSEVFFEDLGLPRPDVFLGVGPGSHAQQTGRIIEGFEQACLEHGFGLVLVGGDVNSTLACALAAAKLCIPVGHVEAGLRSFDRTMPEEINRVLTDNLSDLLFTTEQSANENLKAEGFATDKIHFTGNCMVDSLLRHLDDALKLSPWEARGLKPGGYALMTLHRPSNVDHKDALESIISSINKISCRLPVLFPVHPRTKEKMLKWKIRTEDTLTVSDPLSYLEFLGLMASARLVLTDSGGIQEETTLLGVPCMTLRDNTERPVTLSKGTNRLVGSSPGKIEKAFDDIISVKVKPGHRPDLWDGKAAERIVDVIEKL